MPLSKIAELEALQRQDQELMLSRMESQKRSAAVAAAEAQYKSAFSGLSITGAVSQELSKKNLGGLSDPEAARKRREQDQAAVERVMKSIAKAKPVSVLAARSAERKAQANSWMKELYPQEEEAEEEEEEEDQEDPDLELGPEMTSEERTEMRCKVELAKDVFTWTFVSMDAIDNAHKVLPGMIYGLEFPWNEEMLIQYGPKWLTKAFHAAGTLDPKNRVIKIIPEQTIKVTGGNNAGKFLFEVKYAKQTKDLDTQLFAKVPYELTKETKGDRISSSVYKQPSDLCEINTYRLLEATFPVKMPKYYYGDINNESTNFILITARIPFAELRDKKNEIKPFEVEGPYDKCKDWQLRGDPVDYYMCIVRASAKIGGWHRGGRLAPEHIIDGSLLRTRAPIEDPAAWGFNPHGATGDPPANAKRNLQAAIKFFSQTAKVIFPPYATDDDFVQKFMDTMMTWNAYSAEIEYWKHCDPKYVAVGHMNLNSDNAYFWRDEDGKLDCGVFDWGGFGKSSLGHKVWWCFNCADFDHFHDNLDAYIDAFIETYAAEGGFELDKEVVRKQILLTSLGNTMFMVKAVPNCFKMVSQKDFATIKDRHDPRIADNIFGKSTLRTTLHVLNNGLRVIEELKGDKVLQEWIQEVFQGQFQQTPKTDAMINGT